MSPITHFLAGWLVAESVSLSQRERTAVTIAAIIPDIDALGIVAEKLTAQSDYPLLWWTKYHHVLAHNLGFCLLTVIIVFFMAKRKMVTAGLAAISFHLHLVCDIIGARGPEGCQWPIPYLLPFSNAWQLTWQGQWEINAWPNFVIIGTAIILVFFLAWKRGYSPLEMISIRADRVFVQTLWNRFGPPGNKSNTKGNL